MFQDTRAWADNLQVPELWNEDGSVYVYLFPKESGHGPSFKVPSVVTSASRVFEERIQAERSPTSSTRPRAKSFGGRLSLTAADAGRIVFPSASPPLADTVDSRLYLHSAPNHGGEPPFLNMPQPDIERLVALRNLFAFLTGQPLVCTHAYPTVLAVFSQIASLLKEFGFGDTDGSSWGEAVDLSFGFYMDMLNLADVRSSRKKTLEALIIGEQMRSWLLYNEAFTHAVGKYSALVDLKSPLFGQLSPNTSQRLERAHLDLLNRQDSVNTRLESFDFPSLFTGVANSTSYPQYKNVGFKNWKSAFSRMRSFTLGYYKSLFGNWPPKARSKKNPVSEGGLNRQVLRVLYSDLCAAYDLLVDRSTTTTRVIDQESNDEGVSVDASISAFRMVLNEFDTSSPPVLPPIPHDIPKLPTMVSVLENYDSLPPKEKSRAEKRIQPHELLLILHKSYNFDIDTMRIPFLTEFKRFEWREAKGKSTSEMADARLGYWLFFYVMLQSLPMLVVDAPDLKFTDGVEYFLCAPPRGHLPWTEDADEVRKVWYGVAGRQGIVELSADVIMFSVEATYYRSHCWLAANIWGKPGDEQVVSTEPVLSPLEPPPVVFQDMNPIGSPPPMTGPSPLPGSLSMLPVRERGTSPGRGRAMHLAQYAHNRSSLALGLQPLPPADGGIPGDRTSRVVSSQSSASGPSRLVSAIGRSASAGNLSGMVVSQPVQHSDATFDDILRGMGGQEKRPKKKFF